MRVHTTLATVIVTLLVSACLGQQAAPATEPTAVKVAEANAVPAFPYVAEITGDNVHVRSGFGTNFYSCGKLNKGDRVRVVGSQFSWSQIVPPAGTFSWINKMYLRIDGRWPDVGIITFPKTGVYAGSDYVKPIHSTSLQLKLDRDDKVKLLGEQKDDYYKIAPPEGAYLWVSTKFTRPLGDVNEIPIIVAPPTVDDTVDITTVEGSNTVTRPTSAQAKKLEKYYALEKQMHAEQGKPANQQDYTAIMKGFKELAADKEAGKAARYAEFMFRQVERFELALQVQKAIKLQDAQLELTRQNIAIAREKKLAEVQDLGKFVAVGKFQTSNIFGPQAQLKYYRIVNYSGKKTICYAVPISTAGGMARFDKLIGHKVGLVGTIEPHVQTGSALVRFSEVTKLR